MAQKWLKTTHTADGTRTMIWTMAPGRRALPLCPTMTPTRMTMGFLTRHPQQCTHPRRLVKMLTTPYPRAATTLRAAGVVGVVITITHREEGGETIKAAGVVAGVDVGAESAAEVVVEGGTTDNHGPTVTEVSNRARLMTSITPRSPVRCHPLLWPSRARRASTWTGHR